MLLVLRRGRIDRIPFVSLFLFSESIDHHLHVLSLGVFVLNELASIMKK